MTKLHPEFSNKLNWTALDKIEQLNTLLSPEYIKQLFDLSNTPFTSFEFFSALETSGSVGGGTGWQPRYFLYQYTHEDTYDIGLFISFEKTHSYGEYVFDWAWADAYHRNGLKYYPKLLAAIPFSPVPCSKWLSNTKHKELDAFNVVKSLTEQHGYSSFHYLFPTQELFSTQDLSPTQELPDNEKNATTINWIKRYGHQFHWFNQDENRKPLESFEQFLGLMTARKRKNILKERQKIQNAGFGCYWKNGSEVTSHELETFYQCYHSTYNKRGQMGYLNKSFFQQICQTLGNNVHFVFCTSGEELAEEVTKEGSTDIVAAALYLSSDDTLFGRYWGCVEDYELLHFEACYYQGIEFAIKKGLTCFNPGTQGEHKISRGFVPTHTYSYHQLEIEPFHQAVLDFCRREKEGNDQYMKDCSERLPFRKA